MRMAKTSDNRHGGSQSQAEREQPTGTRRCVHAVSDTHDGEEPLLAFFVPDLSVGGAEQVTVTIVNGLAERGDNVELLLSRFDGELRWELSDRVSVVELPPSRTSVLGVVTHLPALVSYIRRKQPTAMFPHLGHPSIVSLTASRLANTDTAVIPTHHSAFGVSADQSTKDRLVERLIPRFYPTADRIIAVSGGVAESITNRMAVDREDISVLHNPVDVESVRARAQQPVDHKWVEDEATDLVLFVGRLASQKELETWLRAFRRVHERHPQTRGVIAGQGPRREALLELRDEMGLSDVVSMPGYVDNPYRFMGQADTFLLSSRFEGLPTVLIEALACGCPIVSTDCPSGPREILDDGEYGALVPVGDEAGLAEAVNRRLTDPIPPDVLRDRADAFAPESVFDKYEQFLNVHVFSR
jgi:glycosyltransferase involved in cell wall biosynthesis